MVDCLELHENTYNRIKYFKEASKAIQEIEGKKKMPIIVGGTNYYIETLLYNLKNLDRKFSS
jgi:tRNA dimethylallyltransferase